jgi:hypothetical protein
LVPDICTFFCGINANWFKKLKKKKEKEKKKAGSISVDPKAIYYYRTKISRPALGCQRAIFMSNYAWVLLNQMVTYFILFLKREDKW